MLAFIWTYLLPSTGIALVLALLWAQRKASTARADLAEAKQKLAYTTSRLEFALQELNAAREARNAIMLAKIDLEGKLHGALTLANSAMESARDLARLSQEGAPPAVLAAKVKEIWNG